jgi:hypothetical protein
MGMTGFHLTERQEEARRLLAGPQRHTCLVGGVRSGKTVILIRQTLMRAIRAPKSRHAVLRYRANAVRASIWLDTLPKVAAMCFPEVKLSDHRQDGYVELPNGAQIWMSGLDEKDRVEKILGQEYLTIFFNECSQIPYSSVLVARTRLAQKIEGMEQRAYYDLNPVGKGHWTNKLFGDHKDPQTGFVLREPDLYKRMFLNPRDNAANLSPEFLAELEAMPERQRKRFYEGVYVDEVDGALWSLEGIEAARLDPADEPLPDMRRIVVAVDPSGTRGDEDSRSDAVGIVVAGLGVDGLGYILADLTCQLPPAKWGKVVVDAYNNWKADRVVAEGNFGGEMVRFVIQTADPIVPVELVTASRGKVVRAEPVSSLYDMGRVRHAGRFAELEDQMMGFSTAGYAGEKSPDRADAMVWALTDLMVSGNSMVFDTASQDIVIEPMNVPGLWRRVVAVSMDRKRFVAVWGAYDKMNDVVYLYEEISVSRGDPIVHAEAIKARGKWIPAVINMEGGGRTHEEGAALIYRFLEKDVDMFEAPLDLNSGMDEVTSRVTTGRLRVFSSLTNWIAEYRRYRRDEKNELVEGQDHLMQATATLLLNGLGVAMTENRAISDAEGFDDSDSTRNAITGY